MSRSSSNMSSGIGGLTKSGELRQRIFFIIFALIVFRLGSFITLPGIDPSVMKFLFEQQRGSILDMFNMFSGGALSRMSIFALGVMPYISAAIIIQMMSHIYAPLIQLRKEGARGRKKITQYTRYFTVLLAILQSIGVSNALQNQNSGSTVLVLDPGLNFIFISVVTLVTGTMFLVWLGEQITERGIGNGISIIIFAGIVAGLPSAIGNTVDLARNGELQNFTVILIFLLVILITAFVIYIERGQRKIPVNYARKMQGRKMYAAQNTHLPLKINMAGVIPPIFASAIILFPATIASWSSDADGGMIQNIALSLSPGQPLYIMLYALAIIFFCYFYTALVFNSNETADNLKKSGAFIPGIRPGDQTAKYIDDITTRLTTVGAIYITAVCLLPEFLILYFNVPFYFGGTSLLIVVIVVMDLMSQIQAHLLSHQYEGMMKKANLKGIGGGLR
ncbi:MAG: preprotein translocase subunit SecY [Pseudomonadota bacterium]|nr:preprotein translocase subunit SecY [Gammaproteobacteria bacterium]MBS55702.1 preprotein translocase subunit SecY [Gammaproteobacteria bacterium]MEC8085511.1 preprotein translocase subunit SecY [Pseudomonadota bacterium]